MPRTKRMILQEEKATYHIMTRTALGGFPMKDVEKDFLLNLIRSLSAIYFVDVLGLCCMDNHFHLVVQMIPDHHFTDAEINARYKRYYGNDKELYKDQIPFFRNRAQGHTKITYCKIIL